MARLMKLAALLVIAPSMLASCAPMNRSADANALSPRQLELLESNLGGKVAGRAVRCIPSQTSTNMVRVSDTILLYRVSGRLVYKNELRGSCPGLTRDDDIIVSDVYGSGPCRGDIFHLVDRSSGIRGPSCVLGEFVPYRTPAAN